ncbi:uncharacterized protein TRIVIDRAFT_215849 [Trichoderma virens Gv29-8]|uniref:Uncharacterized protein n=1 Tax=Hypocrea virens (strain Gv29-8 / FGSC 10586) TaxID=413071 RepID=G9MP34_HYPVG|nr:uncharacterized protein TRIVIDRAFT_215849 [Trichoderma virens Gv29-8]EHK23635.1 hypothetical protein TRIVIDRAFT_215849 [Trichoderma virens Gv29-8]
MTPTNRETRSGFPIEFTEIWESSKLAMNKVEMHSSSRSMPSPLPSKHELPPPPHETPLPHTCTSTHVTFSNYPDPRNSSCSTHRNDFNIYIFKDFFFFLSFSFFFFLSFFFSPFFFSFFWLFQ